MKKSMLLILIVSWSVYLFLTGCAHYQTPEQTCEVGIYSYIQIDGKEKFLDRLERVGVLKQFADSSISNCELLIILNGEPQNENKN